MYNEHLINNCSRFSGESSGWGKIRPWFPHPVSLYIDFDPLQRRNKREIGLLGDIKLPPTKCLDPGASILS